MIEPGPYLRKNFPRIYFFLISILNEVKKVLSPYSIYITDSLGGSFKSYLRTPDINQIIDSLKKNLDHESIQTVDILIKRIIFFPDEKDKHRIRRHTNFPGGLLQVESKPSVKIIGQELKRIKKEVKYKGIIEESVFYFDHGLKLLPETVINYIRDQDFIDAGSFIGDSAIALDKYRYRKIFSVELSPKSIKRYKLNVEKFGLESERYEIINAAISAVDDDSTVLFDTGSSGLSLSRNRGKYDEILVKKRTLDSIVEEYNIKPRFIKVDIEGSALELVKGAARTLKEFRPVLSIAIYHNPYEFFETKPFLEKLLDNYTFMIRKLATGIEKNRCHSETILLGFPSELI